MRSGVIAQKLRHDPRLQRRRRACAGHCSPHGELPGRGAAHRGEERLHRRSARRRPRQGEEHVEGDARPFRDRFRRAEGQGRASSASPPTTCSMSAPRSPPSISSPARRSTSTGTTIGKGFQGVIKRHHFGGGRATHGNSVSHRSHGSTGQRQDPGKVFKGKKMAGHMGDERVTTQNVEIVSHRHRARPDPDPRRGSGLEGRMDPGARRRQGRRCRTNAPKPAAIRAGCSQDRSSGRTREPNNGPQDHHPRRQGRRQGEALDDDLRPRSARGHPAARRALAARQAQRARTRPRAAREIARTGAKMYKQKGTGRARHHSARAPQFRGGGKAHGPVVAQPRARPAQEGPRARPEACAVGQGQGGEPDHHRRAEADGRQDQGADREFRDARPRPTRC